MTETDIILKSFSPITLEEIDAVRLQNRIDFKYLFGEENLKGFLEAMYPFYYVLEMNRRRFSTYHTNYYDTPGLDLYKLHHNGKLNRFKVRERTYTEDQLSFLEVKRKINKGRTIKKRMLVENTLTSGEAGLFEFVQRESSLNPSILRPVIQINFERITLVNKSMNERLTIDRNIRFITSSTEKSAGKLVIAEIKQGSKAESPFKKLMKEYHIREGSMSKYCMGIASCMNDVKKNNFKPDLHLLKPYFHAV